MWDPLPSRGSGNHYPGPTVHGARTARRQQGGGYLDGLVDGAGDGLAGIGEDGGSEDRGEGGSDGEGVVVAGVGSAPKGAFSGQYG